MRVVVDTSVLVDMFLTNRPRHKTAEPLIDLIRSGSLEILAPFHSLFELTAAIKNEKQSAPITVNSAVTRDATLAIRYVPIDAAFFDRYFTLDVPYLKAGDLLFLLLAKGEQVPLVTEDRTLRERAQEAGAEAFAVEAFLTKFFSAAAGA